MRRILTALPFLLSTPRSQHPPGTKSFLIRPVRHVYGMSHSPELPGTIHPTYYIVTITPILSTPMSYVNLKQASQIAQNCIFFAKKFLKQHKFPGIVSFSHFKTHLDTIFSQTSQNPPKRTQCEGVLWYLQSVARTTELRCFLPRCKQQRPYRCWNRAHTTQSYSKSVTT